MGFWKSVFSERQDNRKALLLLLFFFIFYITVNIPFLTYMEQNKAVLNPLSPFYGAPFTLNLFNFDPSLYYAPQSSVIHPLLNYLSTPLKQLAALTFGNALFLGIQSLINAAGVAIMYYYLRKNKCGNVLAAGTAAFYGTSSYSLFTALIPDSYPYAMFLLLLTVLYCQYCRLNDRLDILPAALLLFLNFGITVTNVVTAAGALFFGTLGKGKQFWFRWIKIAIVSLLLVALFTMLQFFIFSGNSWITTWKQNIHAGGFSYVAPFSLQHHWKAVYTMIESPIITPHLTMINESIMAFVTNMTNPFALHGHLIGAIVIGLTLLALARGYADKEVQSLAVFPLFALLLHIVVGFGLGAFEYDMYLYAGHYLFALFLLSAWFIHSLRGKARSILTGIIVICTIITFTGNIAGHMKALDSVKQIYHQVEYSSEFVE
ncbi:DUF6080 domain-containing protein [Paenibacillus apiarius]|uniref:DUF6080 domain-containing protein n=1 Tax=Paenibacillus apiarius TaxID=46240 RepID=A0ABT4DNR6_9BACL|nr:DUF6080 domain-containing protein [Paenibacillus apiarius]MBN3525299.1 hypothetical protein [Paenibacillus apiarius]MCY9513018.1 DUF6080 domain-containing protein [Paenibacillus apiarius]MCY9519002.1 DUF6080 domain-containing protein [Paenibacillus apiarius]MCY9550811.1 DUF6080 domain-containing protein [Paenibacillus apiarius]MCY9559755.1 DUF6080 domain-containing protein [Paenibacillus apiarius]